MEEQKIILHTAEDMNCDCNMCKENQEDIEKCKSCSSTEDLFKLQDNEGFICRECLFSQYDLSESEEYEELENE